MFEMCGMIDARKCQKSGKLGDLEASQIKKSEVDVKKAMAVNLNFTSLWKIAEKHKICLASSFPVSKKYK